MMKLRYSYSQSQMKPPFWIIKDRQRHMAEVWNEDDAKTIVAALGTHEYSRQKPERDAEIIRRCLDGKEKMVILARHFGISQTRVHSIVHRERKRRQGLTYPNGKPMFDRWGMMLDANGNRSIFDDVDE